MARHPIPSWETKVYHGGIGWHLETGLGFKRPLGKHYSSKIVSIRVHVWDIKYYSGTRMKVYIGDRDRQGEKARLLSLGVHPEFIRPNGNLHRAGIPNEFTLRAFGLRLPTTKEAKYISSLLEMLSGSSLKMLSGSSLVWTRSYWEGYERYEAETLVGMLGELVYIEEGIEVFGGDFARLVLIERED